MSRESVVQALDEGQVEILGQILPSSNVIFLARVTYSDRALLAVYKPSRGESPLWDFPPGTLCLREAAAYLLSTILGWPLIPPTALREGRFGIGTFQLYIDAAPGANYFTKRTELQKELRAVALFDLLVNNADRKGGHLLLDQRNQLWAIDNALTFHTEDKLRTVIWDFAGEPFPHGCLSDLERLHDQLAGSSDQQQALGQLLSDREMDATGERLVHLLEQRAFPQPDPARRQVPWPIL